MTQAETDRIFETADQRLARVERILSTPADEQEIERIALGESKDGRPMTVLGGMPAALASLTQRLEAKGVI